MITTPTRTCKECNQTLNGRKDQKFCSDYCRNAYNNKKNGAVNKHVRYINAILRKNRRILDELNPRGKITVSIMTLAERGFNFHYYTNTYITKKGAVYFFCYDRGYLKVDEESYILVRKQEYVK